MTHNIHAAFVDEAHTIAKALDDEISADRADIVANTATKVITEWSVFEAFILSTMLHEACRGQSLIASPDTDDEEAA